MSKGSANDEETKPPKTLTARMLDNIPIPADAKVIDDQESEERFSEEKRVIKLETSESLYDISHFFRQEMEKNGWKGNERNEREKEERRSIISNLDFSKGNEQANILILANTDDGSEIEITIGRKLEFDVPLHECAGKANQITNNDEFTIRVNCRENLSVLTKFYKEEFPKKGWTLTNQSKDSVSGRAARKIVKIAFTKENLKAVVSLIEMSTDRTSVKITISK